VENLKLLVVCDNRNNIFVRQLTDQNIDFALVASIHYQDIQPVLVRWVNEFPDIVLLVNKNLNDGIKIKKELFPNSKVLCCKGGGRKDFQPYVTHIAVNKDHTFYNYADWSEFIDLIIKPLSAQNKVIKYIAENQYCFTATDSSFLSGSKSIELKNNFEAMLRCSIAYLNWLRKWLIDVGSIEFAYRPDYKKDKIKKKLKTLTISLPSNRLTHLGKAIFNEDDQVIFKLANGGMLEATIKTVTDDDIIVNFSDRQPINIVNSITGFNVYTDYAMESWYQSLCQEILYNTGYQTYYTPFNILRGQEFDVRGDNYDLISLNSTERKILHDTSQVEALAKILGPKHVTVIEGPPGTGKTFLTALAIKCLISQGKRVLITSHSNRGLDSIMEQLANLTSTEEQDLLFRLGNVSANILPDNLIFHRSVRYQIEPDKDGSNNNDSNSNEVESEKQPLTNEQLAKVEYLAIQKLLDKNKGVALFVTVNSFSLDETIKLLPKKITLEVLFIDEATKGYLYELLPALLKVTEKIVFIGDYRQLGNINMPESASQAVQKAKNVYWENTAFFAEGFFYSLSVRKLLPSHLLKINRRSLPLITQLVSEVFYNGEIISGRFTPFTKGEITFLDTKSLPDNREEKKKTSYCNLVEKNLAVKQFIGQVKKLLADGGKITDCAIITPYQAQIRSIKSALRKELLFNQTIVQHGKVNTRNIDAILDATVDTVDAFQGSQKHCIILSLVRSKKTEDLGFGDIGFNEDIRRLNVAISRAQDKLAIIGDSNTFLNCYAEDIKIAFQKIISFIKQKGKYIELTN